MADGYDDIVSSTSQSSTPRVLFSSTRNGGSDIDGALAISVLNTGSADAFVWCKGNQGTTPTASNYGRLPAGLSLTFEVSDAGNASIQLDEIRAKTAGSDVTTLSWLVTKRR